MHLLLLVQRDNSNEAKSAARNIHGFEELANASLRTVRNSVAKKQIELSELWAACPTFWSLCMKDNSNHQNETSERKESHPLAHIRKVSTFWRFFGLHLDFTIQFMFWKP